MTGAPNRAREDRRVAATEYDVIVIGGGLAGFAAARLCAKSSLSTLLIERRPVLGWESTWAFQLETGPARSDASAVLVAAVTAAGGSNGRLLDAPILEMVLDRELAWSGAALLYYSEAVGLGVQGQLVREVVVAGKSGDIHIRGRCFIDATPTGAVWRMAGGGMSTTLGPGRSVAYLNSFASSPIDHAIEIGTAGGANNISVSRGIWPGETTLSYELDETDPLAHVRALPAVLSALREARPDLEASVVTHLSVEPYPQDVRTPTDGGRRIRHPAVANLVLAAGVGVETSKAPAFEVALAAGERAGRQAMAVLRETDPRSSAEPVVLLPGTSPDASETDVLVCGGGTGGSLAAIAAARTGARVLLVEASPLIGGIGVGGGIHIQYMGVPGGLQDEVDDRARAVGGLFGPAKLVRGFHPVARRVVLAEMLAEAGVRVDLNVTVTAARLEDSPGHRRRITGVDAASPGGRRSYRARAVVDGTGDGDVAAFAGGQFTIGREKDGLPHAFSLGAGVRDDERGYLLMMTNADAGYCEPDDVEDLTRARRLALGSFWRERFDDVERKYYIAPLLGVRSSRQIVGGATVEMTDLVDRADFPDVIGYARAHLDNHADDYENESDEAMLWMWLLGYHWKIIGSDIPYRALVPLGIDGLVMGCRALSVSHDAHTTIRMQRDIARIGEAAGIAAALSAERGIAPRDVPVIELQAWLLESGALRSRDDALGSRHDGQPTDSDTFPERTIEAWMDVLEGPDPREAVWPLYRAGREAIPLLVEAAHAGDPVDFWSSVVLAMLGEPLAAPALIRAVEARRHDRSETVKSAPVWWAAVVLLGRIQSRDAVAALTEVLGDGDAGHDVLVAALRSLGRIGDPAAAPAITTALARDDLPSARMLQVSHVSLRKQGHVRAPGAVEDARWEIDLAAAEALAQMRLASRAIVEPYLLDHRAYVRRHAERILKAHSASR